MIKTLIIGIAGMIFLMTLWVVVQSKWREIFVDHLTDEDVLAGRGGCSNCHCTTTCINENKTLPEPTIN